MRGSRCNFMCRPTAPPEEEEALKQALLGGLNADGGEGDVEAPAAKKSRSWYSLFGTALVFVWPDDWVLQVGGDSCACSRWLPSLFWPDNLVSTNETGATSRSAAHRRHVCLRHHRQESRILDRESGNRSFILCLD